ncbi:hypothetical protein F5Y06DRAFT_299821 [Hypoxylon sp. FL0890]|nr:hypothetical protein F5Y06DRAFT_299821 [Hypoxylon sp. FL0890]
MSSLTASIPSPPRKPSTGLVSGESPSASPKLKKTLYVITHDRHTPLSPPVNLQYDLRGVPNPPSAIRERYTGQSRKVREGLMYDPGFRELLEDARTEMRRYAGC